MQYFWPPSDSNSNGKHRGYNSRIVGGENGDMGIVIAPISVFNNRDIIMAANGSLPPDQVRGAQLQALVDTGANWLVLPESLATQLGLPLTKPMLVRFGDGRLEFRNVAEQVRVEVAGRQGTFRAILEPNRTDALIGAIVMEDLDLLVDCGNRTLQPRDPKQWTGNV